MTPEPRDTKERFTDRVDDYVRARPGYFAGSFVTRRHENAQKLDFAGLASRLLSSSYISAAGTPAHAAMLERFAAVFHNHAEQDRVRIDYDTELYVGRLGRFGAG